MAISVKPGDLLVAIFTGLLFLATLALYFATKDLADGEAESAERQLRAYIGVETMTLAKFSPDNAPFCDGSIKNYGQTPASSLQVSTRILWSSVPKGTALPRLSDNQSSHSVLQKDGVLSADSTPYDRLITKEDAALISARKMAFYCVVTVTYKDVFEKIRHTNYEMVFDIDLHGRITDNDKANYYD